MREAEIKKAAVEHVWLHATQMRDVAADIGTRIIVEGKGCRLTDIDGQSYLDGLAGLWLVNAGYGRKEIADAVARQMTQVHYVSSQGFTSAPTATLATKLADLTPGRLSRVFFVSGGSEAIETALKIAKQCQFQRGFPKRHKIISRRGSYHGATFAAMSVSASRFIDKSIFEPLMQGTLHVPPPYCYRCDYEMTYPSCNTYCARAVDRWVQAERPDTVAAIVAEPVSASCGIVIPPAEYFGILREICDRYGILLIADEVITGFGRTGVLWGSQRYGISPDLVTFAKGVTSGYVPLGGVLVGRRVAEPFWAGVDGGPSAVFRHGYTYSGHAGACAAAMTNLDILEREGLVARVAVLEPVFEAALRSLEDAPLVGEVRAVGLMGAVALRPDLIAADPGLAERVVGAALGRGVATRVLRGHAIHVSPAFVITESEIAQLVDGLRSALEDVAAAGVDRGRA